MTLLADILDWSKSDLPAWQQDAVRRLFQKSSDLTDADYCELYALLKLAHEIDCHVEIEPEPLSEDHLPLPDEVGQRVVLKAMRNLSNVNRLPEGEALSFSTDGITIIYGPNASGKSGYARVLKRACRARDQAETVLPDATQDPASKGVPSATFEIESGGSNTECHWDTDSAPPAELSRLSVFDSRCARVYVTAEQDVAYMPYGLDVVENLATRVLPELAGRLDDETGSISVDTQPFGHLLGDTCVGRLVSSLSEQTSEKEIDKLAALSKQEQDRLPELRKTFSEADPAARAKELRLSAKRIKELSRRVDEAWTHVSSDVVRGLRLVQESAASACRVEEAAAEALRSDEDLLPGTGEATWKALFEAARRFSVEAACPNHAFPDIDEGAVCPLCQQALSDDAGRRLARFEAYVRDNAAEEARQKRETLAKDRREMERCNLNVALDGALEDELSHMDGALAAGTRAFAEYLNQRKAWFLRALDEADWDSAPPARENPRAGLRSLAASLLWQARTHEDAADEVRSEGLRKELAELEARIGLSSCMSAVCKLVEQMKRKAALERCKLDLKTRRVSDKSKEFASTAVTNALRAAMETEFANLDVGHVKVALKERTEKGKIWHRLVLDLPLSTKLGEVLSEGEQRAIALGSFLAELSLADHSDGIVFDDPVSSLDHWRRRQVARRLVQEAARRQVIIFTHDTSFLGQLRDEIDEQRVPHSIQFLEWCDDRPGRVREGLPWEHQGYAARMDALEKEQRRLDRLPWPAYPNQEQRRDMAHQYDLLRATIERVVQDVIFAGVVQRYRDWIRVDRLGGAVGFEEPECREIHRLHKRCCNVVDAHDPSSAKDAAVPTASDLKRDIQSLSDVIETIKDKRRGSATP